MNFCHPRCNKSYRIVYIAAAVDGVGDDGASEMAIHNMPVLVKAEPVSKSA